MGFENGLADDLTSSPAGAVDDLPEDNSTPNVAVEVVLDDKAKDRYAEQHNLPL